MEEIWKTYAKDENYKISNHGKVFSKNKEKLFGDGIMSQFEDGHGYKVVSIKGKKVKVHILVAETFLEKENEEQTEVNHKNFDTRENFSTNLEWVTPLENINHMKKHKGISNQFSNFPRVAQYDTDGNLLMVFEKPLEAARYMGYKNSKGRFDSRGINDVCRKNSLIYLGFHWIYLSDGEIPENKIEIPSRKKSTLTRKIRVLTDKNEELFFDSITEASKKLGIRRTDISTVLSGNQKTAKKHKFFLI